MFPKLPVAPQFKLLQVASPVPFTAKGDVVPLKTWNPAPDVAITPADVWTDRHVTDVQFKPLELKYPKDPVPPHETPPDTERLAKLPLVPVKPAVQ